MGSKLKQIEKSRTLKEEYRCMNAPRFRRKLIEKFSAARYNINTTVIRYKNRNRKSSFTKKIANIIDILPSLESNENLQLSSLSNTSDAPISKSPPITKSTNNIVGVSSSECNVNIQISGSGTSDAPVSKSPSLNKLADNTVRVSSLECYKSIKISGSSDISDAPIAKSANNIVEVSSLECNGNIQFSSSSDTLDKEMTGASECIEDIQQVNKSFTTDNGIDTLNNVFRKTETVESVNTRSKRISTRKATKNVLCTTSMKGILKKNTLGTIKSEEDLLQNKPDHVSSNKSNVIEGTLLKTPDCRSTQTSHFLVSHNFLYELSSLFNGTVDVNKKKKPKKKTKNTRRNFSFTYENYVITDPYLKCLNANQKFAQIKSTDIDIKMKVPVGVDLPLYPLIYRNIVNQENDGIISEFWMEFSLSTLVTKISDIVKVKSMLVPIIDPELKTLVIETQKCKPDLLVKYPMPAKSDKKNHDGMLVSLEKEGTGILKPISPRMLKLEESGNFDSSSTTDMFNDVEDGIPKSTIQHKHFDEIDVNHNEQKDNNSTSTLETVSSKCDGTEKRSSDIYLETRLDSSEADAVNNTAHKYDRMNTISDELMETANTDAINYTAHKYNTRKDIYKKVRKYIKHEVEDDAPAPKRSKASSPKRKINADVNENSVISLKVSPKKNVKIEESDHLETSSSGSQNTPRSYPKRNIRHRNEKSGTVVTSSLIQKIPPKPSKASTPDDKWSPLKPKTSSVREMDEYIEIKDDELDNHMKTSASSEDESSESIDIAYCYKRYNLKPCFVVLHRVDVLLQSLNESRSQTIEDTEDSECDDNVLHYFGKNHCSRTFGTPINYTIRNRGDTHIYKLNKMTGMQQRNNKIFERNQIIHMKNVDTTRPGVSSLRIQSVTSLSQCFLREYDLEHEDREIDDYTDFDAAVTALISKTENLKINTAELSAFMSLAGMRWLVVQYKKSYSFLMYSFKTLVPDLTLFEMKYKSEISKKVVCLALDGYSYNNLVKFGLYIFPGFSNLLFIGPYLGEIDHSIHAVAREAGSYCNVPIKLLKRHELNLTRLQSNIENEPLLGCWWQPELIVDHKSTTDYYASFLFGSRSVRYKHDHGKLSLRELLKKHPCKDYEQGPRNRHLHVTMCHNLETDEESENEPPTLNKPIETIVLCDEDDDDDDNKKLTSVTPSNKVDFELCRRRFYQKLVLRLHTAIWDFLPHGRRTNKFTILTVLDNALRVIQKLQHDSKVMEEEEIVLNDYNNDLSTRMANMLLVTDKESSAFSKGCAFLRAYREDKIKAKRKVDAVIEQENKRIATEFVRNAFTPCSRLFKNHNNANNGETSERNTNTNEVVPTRLRNDDSSYVEDSAKSVPAKKRKLSLFTKKKIIEAIDNGERTKDVARRYSLPVSTIATIMKNKFQIVKMPLEDTKRRRRKAAIARPPALVDHPYNAVPPEMEDVFMSDPSIVSGSLFKEVPALQQHLNELADHMENMNDAEKFHCDRPNTLAACGLLTPPSTPPLLCEKLDDGIVISDNIGSPFDFNMEGVAYECEVASEPVGKLSTLRTLRPMKVALNSLSASQREKIMQGSCRRGNMVLVSSPLFRKGVEMEGIRVRMKESVIEPQPIIEQEPIIESELLSESIVEEITIRSYAHINWKPDDMTKAIRAVKRGLAYATAARIFNVPRNTLKRRVLRKKSDEVNQETEVILEPEPELILEPEPEPKPKPTLKWYRSPFEEKPSVKEKDCMVPMEECESYHSTPFSGLNIKRFEDAKF